MVPARRRQADTSGNAVWLWIVVIGVGSILLSRAFACATPFAALAAVAALTLRARDAAALVLFVWAANQVVGFGLLHYPRDMTTLAWGAAIGVAALGGLAAAQAVAMSPLRRGWIAAALALTCAYAAYEVLLLAATWFLPSGPGAFALSVIARIFFINAAAFGLLVGLHWLANMLGWAIGRQTVGRVAHAP